jgi:trehalose 6-phosphate synthase/phosphatase
VRLIIVANRLPISIRYEDGKPISVPSSGGLVSGLTAWLATIGKQESDITETLWIGWPGTEIPEEDRAQLTLDLRVEGSHPIFLSDEEMDQFYFGFCNETIWPLFHYFLVYTSYKDAQWQQYQRVNQIFADTICEVAGADDIIWVHDYHLMLLPRLLRQHLPDAAIGFFLHIPWPSFEVFRTLPTIWRTELLEGMLASDLIGFHTPEYTQYFLRCALRLVGHEHTMGRISLPSHVALAETFPMGIEYHKWHDAVEHPETQQARDEFAEHLKGTRLVLSIDRLDYSKGIHHRLRAFGRFLENHPEWRGKVTLVAVVIPSRVGVEKYNDMKRAIDQIIGNINGKYSQFDWTPIQYHYRSVPFHQLVALYSTASVALVTPLRDGMNLIAKEYVACRSDMTGVLVLSELAGAARELTEAVIINPNDIGEVAEAIHTALGMPVEEQTRRMAPMHERLRRYDVSFWADEFLRALSQIKVEQERFNARYLGTQERERLLSDFVQADRRLLFLDYDGTLVPFAPFPQAAHPTSELFKMLEALTSDERNEIVLISGRDKETMDRWFGKLPIGIVAEHGIWIRHVGEQWQTIKPVSNQWKPRILPLLQTYADRLPGAFVEEKEYSVAWHYRRADTDLAAIRSKELRDNLVNLTANIDLQVMQGNKVVEVRMAGVNKGAAVLRWLSHDSPPFVLAIGDDWTDEDMFAALSSEAYSVRVGMIQSHARYNVRHYLDVRNLLDQLAHVPEVSR